MNPKKLLAESDTTAPERDEMMLIQAQLRQACESDPTLERKWMLLMSRYIFFVVGDWHEKVSTSHRELEEKVARLEQQIEAIYHENNSRLNNQELTVNLCLKVANTLFDAQHTHKGQQNAKPPTHAAGTPVTRTRG